MSITTISVVFMLLIGGVGAFLYIDQSGDVSAASHTVRAQAQCQAAQTQLRADLGSDNASKGMLVADAQAIKTACAAADAAAKVETAQDKKQGITERQIQQALLHPSSK